MTEVTARRAILALMGRECFDYATDLTGQKPYEAGLTFTVAEIAQAKKDRKRIAEHYDALKRKRSFWESETMARMKFLAGLEGERP